MFRLNSANGDADKSPGCFILSPAGLIVPLVSKRVVANGEKKAPYWSRARLTHTRVSPTRCGLCNGVGRAAGNERVASISHTLAARQEHHYPGFQPPGRPCYPQVLSIVSCHIIGPQPQLFIEAPTEFHDSETACMSVRTSRCTVTCCSPHPEAPPANGVERWQPPCPKAS